MSYLFLAIPNFCGSTLIHSVLETSPTIVPLTAPNREDVLRKEESASKAPWRAGFVEGNTCAPTGYKHLKGPHSIEANMEHVYSDPRNYDLDEIKCRWEENWSETNPYAEVKLQKTPADVLRVPVFHPHFDDLRWIVSVRNPYVYADSIIKRSSMQLDPVGQLDQVCHHIIRVMELQIENDLYLGDRAYTMTYEDFTAAPQWHAERLVQWFPELQHVSVDSELTIKGQKSSGIYDDGEEKLQELLSHYPDMINWLNYFFKPKEKLLNYWGYELR
jgi:hypothetical protein